MKIKEGKTVVVLVVDIIIDYWVLGIGLKGT